MAKITRAPQKIFGGALSAAGNIAVFGSLANGAKTYSLNRKTIQSLAKYDQGWSAATVGDSSPALQDRNALDYLFSAQLAYLLQTGLAEWDVDTIYYDGSVAAIGRVWYVCIVDGTTGAGHNPASDTNNWIKFTDLISTDVVPRQQRAKAWVIFNGQGASGIIDSYGVGSVTKVGTGVYDVNFSPALDFAAYVYQLSLEQENAVQAAVIGTRFPGDTKTINTLRIRTVSCVDSTGFDCPEVCLTIFSS